MVCMMSEVELQRLCQRLGCPPATLTLIQAIQSAPPSRRVRSAVGNVSVRYPRRKMGVTIQAESHRNELAAIYSFEHDPDTLVYLSIEKGVSRTFRDLCGKPNVPTSATTESAYHATD